jgi:hypothetical protein
MVRIETDPMRRLRIARLEGRVDDAELISEYRRLLRDPDYDPEVDELVDLRGVLRFAISAEGLRGWLSLCQARGGRRRRRRALVAGSPLTYGMSRIFESLTADDGPERVRVFLDLAEAEVWLGAPAAEDAA